MSEESLHHLSGIVKEQSKAIKCLEEKVATCREELDVVCECLKKSGVIGPDALGICMHRRKFAAARASFGLSAEAGLEDSFNLGNVTLAVSLFAGSAAMGDTALVSKTISVATRTAWPFILERATISLYVCGGRDDEECSDFVERFSPKEGAWEVLPQMRQQRCGAMAGAIAGKLYVCGGFDGASTLSSVECFCQEAHAWQSMPSMLSQRAGGAAAVLAGNLYICGGYNTGMTLRSVECFQPPAADRPHAGAWTSCPAMHMEREWPAFSAVAGRLYCCGGKDGGDPGRPLSSVECFDPSAWAAHRGARWQSAASMIQPRVVATAATIGAWLYVCGGWTTDHQDLNSVERFHPGSGIWEVTAPMLVRRYGAAGAVAASHLYIFGGSNDEDGELDSVEHFDATANNGAGLWIALPPMSEKRADPVAATILRW